MLSHLDMIRMDVAILGEDCTDIDPYTRGTDRQTKMGVYIIDISRY
jgi:hypothetical protein